MRRRGFTVIELSTVLAVMAVLVALTVPEYRQLVLRAQTEEARTTLSAIAHAELRYHRDHGQFLACGEAAAAPKRGTVFPAELPCWKALGISLGANVRYAY